MYGWEVMPPSMCDYPTWGAFKPEPMDYTVDQKHMKAELSPTSPHSIDSNESSQNNTSFNDHPPQQHTTSTPLYTSVRHQLNLMNPLTPPEYNGQPLNDTSSQPTDTIHSEETNNKLPKSFEPAEILTPRCTPPMNMTPPKTPKYLAESPPENPTDIDLQSFSGDDIMDSDDDLRTPKMNSHGKVKTFKCKQCEFVAVTKLNFWEHTKSHIKPEKMLNCQKCPFVTEYKHHLEYHMRNHDGTKPFRCSQCPYSCVNKSMLNSHLKSHSNIYQFRCGDCNYATKYCHSLKLHLRKYNHKPGLVLNMDGTPNPLPIIDVYGTRRGPKSKSGSRRTSAGKSESFEDEQRFNPEFASDFMYSPTSEKHMPLSPVKSANLHSMLPSLMNNPFANLLNSPAAHNFSAMFPYFNFNIQMLAAQQQAAMAGKLTSSFGSVSQLHSPVDSNQLSDGEDDVFTVTEPMTEEQSTPLNLETNINCVSKTNNNSPVIKSSSPVKKDDITPLVESTTMTVKNKRKGIAFKFDALREEAVESTTSSSDEKPQCDEVATNLDVVSVSQKETQIASIKVEIYECKFCEIVFKDAILHTIHMGYHGFNDVFKCNSCGEKCSDRVSFFLHIARKPHN